jgi:hypothetical protein
MGGSKAESSEREAREQEDAEEEDEDEEDERRKKNFCDTERKQGRRGQRGKMGMLVPAAIGQVSINSYEAEGEDESGQWDQTGQSRALGMDTAQWVVAV